MIVCNLSDLSCPLPDVDKCGRKIFVHVTFLLYQILRIYQVALTTYLLLKSKINRKFLVFSHAFFCCFNRLIFGQSSCRPPMVYLGILDVLSSFMLPHGLRDQTVDKSVHGLAVCFGKGLDFFLLAFGNAQTDVVICFGVVLVFGCIGSLSHIIHLVSYYIPFCMVVPVCKITDFSCNLL